MFSSGGVSQGDWLHYYNLFSAAIPEDTHFQVTLWSVWRQADVPVVNTFKPPTSVSTHRLPSICLRRDTCGMKQQALHPAGAWRNWGTQQRNQVA